MEQENTKNYMEAPLTQPTLERLGVKYENSKDGEWREQIKQLRRNVKPEDFPEMKNSTILQVFQKQKIDHLPVWMMRQAGRYLPEFKETRKFGSFFDLCEHPVLACEVTLQPLARMPTIDASIIFSDILVIPQSMGMEVTMVEKQGPVFPHPLRELSDLEILKKPDVEASLGHVFDAIYLTRQSIQGNQVLYGFCGCPWTLFTYMTEGSGSKMFAEAKKWIYTRREESLKVLEMISDISVEYLSGQIRAGAQVVQMFDSWGGELGGQDYLDFAFNWSVKIATELKKRFPETPITFFSKGQSGNLELHFKQTCFDAIGIDYAADLEQVVALKNKYNRVVMGNLDPGVILGTKEFITEKVQKLIDTVGTENYIVNLGHGLWPYHNPEHVKHFVETVQNYSRQQIQKK